MSSCKADSPMMSSRDVYCQVKGVPQEKCKACGFCGGVVVDVHLPPKMHPNKKTKIIKIRGELYGRLIRKVALSSLRKKQKNKYLTWLT